ncbi:hypothetical protein ES707_22390 [subsurface metagenome]
MTITNELQWVGIKPTAKTALEPGKQVPIGVADFEILAANNNRTSFALVVRGTVNVFIKLGTGATVAAPEFEPGDVLSCDDYTGAVHGIVAGGVGRVHVFEV